MSTLTLILGTLLVANGLGWVVSRTTWPGEKSNLWLALLLGFWLIPPYVHAALWSTLFPALPAWWLACGVLGVLATPLVVLLPRLVVAPRQSGWIVNLIIALFVATHFSVPDHLKLETTPVVIYQAVSRGQPWRMTLTDVFPLLLLHLVLYLGLLRSLLAMTTSLLRLPQRHLPETWAMSITAGAFIFVIVTPILGLVRSTAGAMLPAWRVAWLPLLFTWLLCACVGLLVSMLVWFCLRLSLPWRYGLGLFLLIFPSTGLAGLVLALTPLLPSALASAPILLGGALVLSMLPWGLLAATLVDSRHGQTQTDKPKMLLAAGVATFWLSCWEVGAGLLLLPVGATTLPVLFYDVMHYGNSRLGAALALIWILLTLPAWLAALWLGAKRVSHVW